MLTHLSQIVDKARNGGRRRLAVACAADAHTIEAVHNAWREGIVDATLFGDRESIADICKGMNIDPDIFTVVDEKNDLGSLTVS